MRKRSKSFIRKIIKLLILLIILFFVSSVAKKYLKFDIKNVGQAQNKNYSGVGQEKVKNQDGYNTIFITDNKKEYKEYKQGGSSSWKDREYWGGTMEENGCGITSMSIILSGYGMDYSPEVLRKKYFPKLNYANLSKELSNNFGIENSDFLYANVYWSEKKLEEHLLTNRPILVCLSADNGKNRFTAKSHYMVLLATDEKGKVYISNPNGLEGEANCSGWYDFDYVIPYIAKVMYITSY